MIFHSGKWTFISAGGFGARRELEGEIDAIDAHGFAGGRDLARGRDEGACADGDAGADAGVDQAARVLRQRDAELVERAALHGGTGYDVFADGGFEEALRRDHLHLAGLHILQLHEAGCACEVVGMGVGVDHGDDGALADMLGEEIEGGFRGFVGAERVDHDMFERS